MSEVVREISKAYKVPLQRILDSSSNREGALLRGISAYVAKEIGGITLSEAAKQVLSSVLCEFSEYWQIGPYLPDPI